MFVVVTYNGNEANLSFKVPVITVRQLLGVCINKYGVQLDRSTEHWHLFSGGIRLYLKADMDRRIEESGEHFVLKYVGPVEHVNNMGAKLKKVKLEKEEETQKTQKQDIVQVLVRWQQRNQATIASDRESNGITHEQMFYLQECIGELLKERHNYVFNLRKERPFEFLRRNNFCLTPYITPGHVALLARVGNRVLHMDPSGSIRAEHYELYSIRPKCCWTFVNYQAYDQTSQSLAGGSCGFFTALGIVLVTRVEPRLLQNSFDVFWGLLRDVMELSTSLTRYHKNLLYCSTMLSIQLRDDMRQERVMPVPKDVLQIPGLNVEEICRDILVKEECDYTCDILFLSLMKETGTGFDRINRLGNVLRGFLQDAVLKKSFDIASHFDNNNLDWLADQLWQSMSCHVCNNNATSTCGNGCLTFYCSQKCAQRHWEMGHNKE